MIDFLTNLFLNEINYVKPAENYTSFIQKYMDIVRQRINHDNLKSIFENYDKDCLGTLTRINYVLALSNILPEYNDVDHMRFVRINDLFDKSNKGEITVDDLINIISGDEVSNEEMERVREMIKNISPDEKIKFGEFKEIMKNFIGS